jgi:hypothetical protein
MDWTLKYIGQTGRTLQTRYTRKEHIHAVKNNNGSSGYSNHVLNTGYGCESITSIMEVLKTE